MSIPQVPAQGCYYEAHNNVVDSFKDTFSCMSKLQIKDRTDEADGFLSKIGKIFALIVLFIPVGICYAAQYLYNKVTDCCNKTTVALPNGATPPVSTEPTAARVNNVATGELGTNAPTPPATQSLPPRVPTPPAPSSTVTVEDATSPSPDAASQPTGIQVTTGTAEEQNEDPTTTASTTTVVMPTTVLAPSTTATPTTTAAPTTAAAPTTTAAPTTAADPATVVVPTTKAAPTTAPAPTTAAAPTTAPAPDVMDTAEGDKPKGDGKQTPPPLPLNTQPALKPVQRKSVATKHEPMTIVSGGMRATIAPVTPAPQEDVSSPTEGEGATFHNAADEA